MIHTVTHVDSLSAISILLVHPHPPTQERVGRALRMEGYQVRVVACGSDAIMLAQRHRLDAVLLDLSGPTDRILAVLTALRIETPHLPVLLLAGNARPNTIASALDLGALAVLPAPYDIDILSALLRRALAIETMTARAEETEQRLHEHRERFGSLVESTPDAIVLADHRGHIVTWNQGAHRLFLYTETEAMGQPLTLLMPIRYRIAHQRGLERFRFTGVSRIAGTTVEIDGGNPWAAERRERVPAGIVAGRLEDTGGHRVRRHHARSHPAPQRKPARRRPGRYLGGRSRSLT